MEKNGKPESQRSETTALRRLLLWLFVVFALGDAPLAADNLVDSADNRWNKLSRELGAGTLPPRYLAPADTVAFTEPAETDRIRLKAFAGDADDGGQGIFPTPSLVERRGLPALAVSVDDQNRQNAATGFSSRAPPAQA